MTTKKQEKSGNNREEDSFGQNIMANVETMMSCKKWDDGVRRPTGKAEGRAED